ncbi:hypothetical protein LCGC14_0743250 [marine sediment metagenome]|uniref:Uncharacterized protein n=1 Tax=marine sediment metagenome TaxID=412755 RepID=A0A0F9Q632_9ZZZZ
MPTHQIIDVINGQPTFEKKLDEIFLDCKKGGAIKILSPLDYHTDQQRKWYRGVCLKGLSDWNGNTPGEWDLVLKALCSGSELLKKEDVLLPDRETCIRLTIVGVGKKNMTAFIENILSKAIEMDWPVTPPDPELRKT